MSKRHGSMLVVRETCGCGARTRGTYQGGRWTYLKSSGHAFTCLHVPGKGSPENKNVSAKVAEHVMDVGEA